MPFKTLTSSHLLPGVPHVAKVSFGALAAGAPDVLWPATDISIGTILFKAPVGTLITNLRLHIRTAFGSSGAFVMNVGDATDPDGYFESTDLVASDVGIHSMTTREHGSTGAASVLAHVHGKLVSALNTLDTKNLESAVVVTVGTAPLNAGLADFYVEYMTLGEL